MKKYLAAAMLTTALIAGAASAQTATANKTAADNAAAAHREGEWRGSKLVGINVYNDANEKIGDINDIILDKSDAGPRGRRRLPGRQPGLHRRGW